MCDTSRCRAFDSCSGRQMKSVMTRVIKLFHENSCVVHSVPLFVFKDVVSHQRGFKQSSEKTERTKTRGVNYLL